MQELGLAFGVKWVDINTTSNISFVKFRGTCTRVLLTSAFVCRV